MSIFLCCNFPFSFIDLLKNPLLIQILQYVMASYFNLYSFCIMYNYHKCTPERYLELFAKYSFVSMFVIECSFAHGFTNFAVIYVFVSMYAFYQHFRHTLENFCC